MALSVEHFGRTYATATGSFTAVADLSFSVRSGDSQVDRSQRRRKDDHSAIAYGILRPTPAASSTADLAEPAGGQAATRVHAHEPHLFEC
jgi:hypothetical protein